MPRVEVPMPQMGESIAEGTVSTWLKKVGDLVERDEPIMEISTDKVDAEIPSPASGLLDEILVREGETVEVGTVVGYINTDREAASRANTGPAAGAGSEAGSDEDVASAAPATDLAEGETSMPAAAAGQSPVSPDLTMPASVRPARASTHPLATEPDRAPAIVEPSGLLSEEERLRRYSTPLVRRIAEEHGVRIQEVPGTGRMGRVTKDDILRYVESTASRDGAARQAAVAGGPGPDGGMTWSDYYSHVQHPVVEAGPGDRVEAMHRMTSLIAEHMILSKRTAAHVHSYFEVDYGRIDRLRMENRQLWEQQGVKVTYTAFITKAVAQALREQPKINASVSGRQVIYRGEVNVGIAVALEWGLIVPVIRNADDLSLVGLARAITDLAERARTKRLSPEEVEGGTFTITNPGIFGTVLGFPIVNQPQVAILAVGAAEKRPVVVTDENGNDAIGIRRRGFIALGYDHRLVNGADGDRFLGRVKELLENFVE